MGLLDNPAVDDDDPADKYRVPTLRNVAETGPYYMHNGVFQELETAILFYDRFALTNIQSQTNPETGAIWVEPEVPYTIDLDLLRQGQLISDVQAEALIAILGSLTDRRHEPLPQP